MSGVVASKGGVKDTYLKSTWIIPAQTKGEKHVAQQTVIVRLSSADEVWLDKTSQDALNLAANVYTSGQLNSTLAEIGDKLRAAKAGGAGFGTEVSGEPIVLQQSQPAPTDTAGVGDKLLVPWTWPEPTAPAILARLQPIPSGTVLPGVTSVSGYDDNTTI
jgi:hypothetical protein